jgi:protein transport protein SEC23
VPQCNSLPRSSKLPLPSSSQGDSKSRHLVSVVNPSVTHNQSGYGSRPGEGHEVVTDDVTLKVFLEHLTKLAVQGPQ